MNYETLKAALYTGDNIDVLRGINDNVVDLVYLDPPFNSNRNYAAPIGSPAEGQSFKDVWTLDDIRLEEHGLLAEAEPALYEVIAAARLASGKGMQAYLTMMASRLLELRRVLKPTGSLYLHCDDTAGAYLRLVLDCVFGKGWFQNEVVWKRTSGRANANRYGRVHDLLLYYSGSNPTWNPPYRDHDEDYLKKFNKSDERGRYQDILLSGTPTEGNTARWIGENVIPGWPKDYADLSVEERRRVLDEYGLLHWTKTGKPRLKLYLEATLGTAVTDLFLDIPAVNSQAVERTGWSTQKPLALLERIINASSNPGDLVLDPFCGCATACLAAEKLGRRWIGIDESPLARKIVRDRLSNELGLPGLDVAFYDDPPVRTDLTVALPKADAKHELYGKQEGDCAGCLTHFPFRNLTIDHIVPKKKGGADHQSNYQLLCQACNSTKGTRSQAEFLARLKEKGIR